VTGEDGCAGADRLKQEGATLGALLFLRGSV